MLPGLRSGWRGARGSSFGVFALGGYGTLSINNVWRFKMKMVKSLLLAQQRGSLQ